MAHNAIPTGHGNAPQHAKACPPWRRAAFAARPSRKARRVPPRNQHSVAQASTKNLARSCAPPPAALGMVVPFASPSCQGCPRFASALATLAALTAAPLRAAGRRARAGAVCARLLSVPPVGWRVSVLWLVWGCPVARSLSVPPLASSVVRSARAGFTPWSGAALGVSFRSSSRAFSGFVAVARFSSPVAAGRFARSWGARLGPACCWCCVRPVSAAAGVAPSWVVSVPVAPPPVAVGRGRASRVLAALFAARCGFGLSAGA